MLEIRLLGEQQVMAAGTSIEALRSPRTLGLLAYLVLHAGVPQLRSHVAGLFWPEAADQQLPAKVSSAAFSPGGDALPGRPGINP